MYAKRPHDENLTTALLRLRRPSRHHLPVVAPNDHPVIREREEYLASFPYKLMGGLFFFTYACNQFSKIYFPYGIVLRRSIPQTWAQYVSYRAPLGLVFLTWWYY